MKKYFLLLLILLPIIAFSQTWKSYQNARIASYSNGYYEYLPKGYDGIKKFPLIVFMHGSGQSGDGVTQLSRIVSTGLPMYIENGSFRKDFIVIAIQSTGWSSGSQANDVVDWAIKNRQVDINRIYVTGLSMGGAATMEFIGGWGYKAAAAFPICPASGLSSSQMDSAVKWNIGVAGLHAKDDPTCSYMFTVSSIDGLNSRMIKPVAEKTILQSGGHGIWNNWYDPTSGFYEKMLTYSRSSNITPVPPPIDTVPVLKETLSYAPGTFPAGWMSDKPFRVGGNYTNQTILFGPGYEKPIVGTPLQDIYSQEVWDRNSINYKFPVQNGSYIVRMHFDELYHTAAGRRLFNVDIEGQRVLTDFDIFMITGSRFVALTREFVANVSDGILNVDFITVKDGAKVNAIEIIPGTIAPTYTTNIEIRDSASGVLLKKYTDTFNSPVKVIIK